MSILKVNNLQVGQDGTAANNYTLYQPASPDGTVRLGYGVAGSVTDILTLKNSRLGIGTDNPQAKLVVSDGSNGLELNPNSSNAVVSYNRSTSAYAPIGLQGSTVQLRIGGVGTALHVHSDGKVGIGTDTPGASLHVLSSAYPTATIQRDHAVNYPRLRLINTANDGADLDGIGDGTGGFRISTVDAGTSSERLRIDSAGRMGLGVAPSNFGTNRTALEIHSPSATVTHLALTNSTTGSNGASNGFNIIQNGNNALLYLRENGNMTFSTNNLERIHIAANGQVLVGNYATHSSIHGNLEVNGNDGINISNATRSGTNGAQWRLIPHNGGGSATNLRLYEGAGGVEVINITKTGNVGIGQVSPQGDLHIGNISGSKDLIMHSANNGNARVRFREGGSNASGFNEYSIGMVGNRNAITINGQGAGEIISILGDTGFVGIGTDSPTSGLEVKRATAGTIAKFYDTGSNGGALYNGGPIVGLSRVSNGSVSLDGLLFQVGIDTTNSTSYNISETVFCVGNKGVGIGEDEPQVSLHLSKTLSATSSYKDAQMIRIAGTGGANHMAGIGFGYTTANPATSAYPSAWIGAKVSSWTAYVKHDLVFATRDTDTNTEPEERFRITESGQLIQSYDTMYRQQGYFRTNTSVQNNSNAPSLAGALSYGFGYQDGFSSSSGGWSFPYPKLILGYHTGVNLGGHRNYYGCRFFEDHPSNSSSIVLSVGNQSTGVHVTNTLTAGTKTFRIVHPHPSKKYTHDLVHSVIEGPQCDNIYRGKVDLVNGTASINIDTVSNMTDGTFVLLNRDVQCFTSNETGWTAVKGSVSGNILTITAKSSSCTDTISWMVIGERQDDKIKSPDIDVTDSDGKLIIEPLTIEQTHM